MKNVPHTASKEQVEEFYNSFKNHQQKLGINIRHRTIFRNLKREGLQKSANVLEVGCGIGTVSSLILKYLSDGKFVGVDISKDSIELAKKINSGYKNANFVVDDMSRFSSPIKFSFVVMPDVLEHIPVEHHNNLFKVIGQVTTPDAVVLINIPEPNCLNWIRRNQPEKLQIIDQSLSMQDLLNNVYPHGFYLYSMNSYALQYKQNDYTSIVLKKKMAADNYVLKNKVTLGTENLKSKILS